MSNKTAGAAVHDLIEARWLRRDERKNRHGLVFEYVYVLSQGRRFAVKTTANMAVESTAPTKTEKTDDTRKASGVTDGLTAVVVQGPWGDPWGESAYG
ncbi:hypothetical protein FHT44_004975 [Mycolicibacterium sp. BK634]|nr:hypothetical protein [Mycolicibacterium sp. BK634]